MKALAKAGRARAERYGGSRLYTLPYQGKDVAGNTTNCQATVRRCLRQARKRTHSLLRGSGEG